MADVSKITVGNTTYDLKDTKALHANGIWYGTSDNELNQKNITATLINGEGFSLTEGVCVVIKFKTQAPLAPVTLSVNGTAAKTLMQYGTTQITRGTTSSGWDNGSIVMFIYDGIYWVRNYWYNTMYSTMQQAEADEGTNVSPRSISSVVLSTTIANQTAGKENSSNKVTSLSSSSTDTEYPSAKCVYDLVGNVESLLSAL